MTLEPWRQTALRSLPAVHEVLAHPVCEGLIVAHGQSLVSAAASRAVAAMREHLLAAAGPEALPPWLRQDQAQAGSGAEAERGVKADAVAALARATARDVVRLVQPSLRPVINATGIVLHTNLGRAVLAPQAVAAVTAVAGSYNNLEFDLETGERGSRYAHVEALLCHLTGAEAALVVNNNAAAVLLALSALAHGREAIVSRGELVEIGGSFRVPDVMRQSGVTLREVGTTNRTHLRDYAAAIGPETALLLKVHTSNYRIEGFVAAVTAEQLVRLGDEHGLPVLYDLGSGTLADLAGMTAPAAPGLAAEPTIGASIAAGIGLVTASGDKLLGGPQAGLLLGRRELIERCRRHPLTRAVRIDKLTLAALEATLRLYVSADATATVPTLQMLLASPAELRPRAAALVRRLRQALRPLGVPFAASVRQAEGQAGGGSLPAEALPGYIAALRIDGVAESRLAAELRLGEPAVVARQQHGELWFDPRTVLPGQERALATAVADAVRRLAGPAAGQR